MPFLEMEICDLNQVYPNASIGNSYAHHGDAGSLGSTKIASDRASIFPEAAKVALQPRRPSLKKNSSYPICDRELTCSSTSNVESGNGGESRPRRRVSFSSVDIREHTLTLGDHPDCSYGPPTSLDWDFEQIPTVDLDQYEESREPRRTLRQMVLNYHIRMRILQAAGHSTAELKHASKQTGKAKANRSSTRAFLQFSKVEEALQSAKRKVKRAVGNNKDNKTLVPAKDQIAANLEGKSAAAPPSSQSLPCQ
mmetsp:Transcript_30420/g.46674  ORF Transcript_30420/g.46674 Transcript_30420/m.46674 type:complete len:252 (-) Transcript_30420:295-1050(-)|eukprot:CAMPEP_0195292014 /NCGR_PEP_ID=MMETSP0707-20130614/8562_1 /TAXON_ID=33640 /ORGANISM="Asterionellopsis glacialis, Strain CCMP134" /LENGTH=251 /DNA_ID=CAMNT_0040352387 /DNA_START=43 /DNA_END=798 /DNA_ORIENTATION=-